MRGRSVGLLTYPRGYPLRRNRQDRDGRGTKALEDAGRHRAQLQTVAEPDREEPAHSPAAVSGFEGRHLTAYYIHIHGSCMPAPATADLHRLHGSALKTVLPSALAGEVSRGSG